MKREEISIAVGNISNRHIQEAGDYSVRAKHRFFRMKPVRAVIAAVAAAAILLGSITVYSLFDRDAMVKVYAHGNDQEITDAGAVMDTGTISDTGVMKGHPLMFYLQGEDIATVRFSCKNQQLYYMDWTEKRDEFGLAQNFTVTYGDDESEYYYLLIDWVPNYTIQALDNEDMIIAKLPEEMREDVIVMEITFANGKTAVKAINVSLLDDGRFFAELVDYEVTEADDFVRRPDSEAIPRSILYAQGSSAGEGNVITGESNASGESDAFDESDAPDESDASGMRDYSSDGNDDVADMESDLARAEQSARDYYAGTVFVVESMQVVSQSENEILFSVCVWKDGVRQEPNRTITLQRTDDVWEVVNEGY